jgi:hypothetical protein
MMARTADVQGDDATAQDIADRLNAEGWRPPKKAVFAAASVRNGPIWSAMCPAPTTTK